MLRKLSELSVLVLAGTGRLPISPVMIEKSLIANSGEIACRVIRAAKALGVGKLERDLITDGLSARRG